MHQLLFYRFIFLVVCLLNWWGDRTKMKCTVNVRIASKSRMLLHLIRYPNLAAIKNTLVLSFSTNTHTHIHKKQRPTWILLLLLYNVLIGYISLFHSYHLQFWHFLAGFEIQTDNNNKKNSLIVQPKQKQTHKKR